MKDLSFSKSMVDFPCRIQVYDGEDDSLISIEDSGAEYYGASVIVRPPYGDKLIRLELSKNLLLGMSVAIRERYLGQGYRARRQHSDDDSLCITSYKFNEELGYRSNVRYRG